jgi:hypothetical protein
MTITIHDERFVYPITIHWAGPMRSDGSPNTEICWGAMQVQLNTASPSMAVYAALTSFMGEALA